MPTSSPRSGGPPSIGRPSPSRMRPRRSGPTATRSGPPVLTTGVPVPMPGDRAERQAGEPVPVERGHLGQHGLVGPSPIRSRSPTRASSPLTVTRRPTAPVTLPRLSGRAAVERGVIRLRKTSVMVSLR